MGFCDCCDPPPPEGATVVLGRFELVGDGCCGCKAPYVFKADACCLPAGPKDSRWTSALPGLEPLMKEVPDVVSENPGCCGDPHYFAVKAALDASWTGRVNEHLARFGLVAQTFASTRYVSHGQHGGHMQPYLQLLVYALDNPHAQEEMDKMARVSAENAELNKKGPTDKPTEQIMSA
mmetsp:Transcript_44066/g.111505  ORF Transcript_44066/g.111505 Transcript_44066/m.111505 type:complete len:178 (+) Transcript_44066:111-644(+)